MRLKSETVHAILSRWMDEGIVTDYCAEYGEPGYEFDPVDVDEEHATRLFVLGDWWCRCGKILRPADAPWGAGEPDLHDVMTHHPRLWAQLAAQGVETAFYDEWIVDHENDKAYRTTGDCYSWQPSYVMTEDCELLTPDDDIDTWIEWAANDHHRCIPGRVYTGADLVAAGFQQHNGKFENGWHPGQDDDPAKISADIRRWHGDDVEIVFALDSTGQFDIAFSAYFRGDEVGEDDE